MKTLLALSLFTLAFEVLASLTYYPTETIEKFQAASISPNELREEIFLLSELVHIKVDGEHDILSDSCPKNTECTTQLDSMSYEEARRIMFGDLFLETTGNGQYTVKEVYCNKEINQNSGVGPGRIPNPNIINCEHTWPQSKFTSQFSKNMQKTDLHHLFPSDSKANSTRSNFIFAEVNGKATNSSCLDSKIGNALGTQTRAFEPPIEHRGNVARALMYFSTRYKTQMDPLQLSYLKKWHEEDPVDEAEIARNDKIMEIQRNRNPFIDFPELVNKI